MKSVRSCRLCRADFCRNHCCSGSFERSCPGETKPSLVETIQPVSSKDLPRATTQQARRQAEILHTSIHATLQVVHDRYYREDEGLPIPAAIMGNVFKEIESAQNVRLRWLAVEGLAMNTDHLPQDTFETEAVRFLKSGEKFHERSRSTVSTAVRPRSRSAVTA